MATGVSGMRQPSTREGGQIYCQRRMVELAFGFAAACWLVCQPRCSGGACPGIYKYTFPSFRVYIFRLSRLQGFFWYARCLFFENNLRRPRSGRFFSRDSPRETPTFRFWYKVSGCLEKGTGRFFSRKPQAKFDFQVRTPVSLLRY